MPSITTLMQLAVVLEISADVLLDLRAPASC